MIALGIAIAALALFAPARVASQADDVSLSLEPQLTGGFLISLVQGDEQTVFGHIGRTLVSPYASTEVEGGVAIQIGGANLTLYTLFDDTDGARGIKIRWDAAQYTRLEDCIDFGTNHWYAGPMQLNQVYPIETAELRYKAYVSTENDNGAISERYWLNSAGEYIYVLPEVPLFVDYNNIMANHICFGAQLAEPYSSRRNHTPLSYDIWFLSDVKTAHKHAVANYLGQPSNVTDFRMVQHPIWSTWAQFSTDINETNLLQYANDILDNGFNNSQFEIDDLWEVCYGSLTVDENKFPYFYRLVQQLKELGFRVTLWVHPFINRNCDPWYTEALDSGFLIHDENGSPNGTWWNSNGTTTGSVDFTNPDAAEWWYRRVRRLAEDYGVDSFKFDAGETDYSPQIAVQHGDIDLQPSNNVQAYVRTCARFGDMVEVRSGFRTQDLPIFLRMVDRDSIWGLNNGLATVLTTTFQMNLNGYTLVLPDMIGGNGFNLNHNQADLPTKELFIRWVQLNTFLPAMQFSFAPWNFDQETVNISRKYTELHAAYADAIHGAMAASAQDGELVNAPLWWVAPQDPEALLIWDEYLLGSDILVAPVITEGATSRDVYLPAGRWFEEGDPERLQEGPVWLRNYPAPLDTLPYFVREPGSQPDAASVPIATISTLILGVVVSFFFRN